MNLNKIFLETIDADISKKNIILDRAFLSLNNIWYPPLNSYIISHESRSHN